MCHQKLDYDTLSCMQVAVVQVRPTYWSNQTSAMVQELGTINIISIYAQ